MSMHPDALPLVRRRRVRPPKDPDKRPLLLGIHVVDGLGLLHQIAAAEKALMNAINNVRDTIPAFWDIHSHSLRIQSAMRAAIW